MATQRRTRVPQGLGVDGVRLWRELSTFEFESGERILAEQAARTADDLARLGNALVGAPLMVTGSKDQTRVNPLVSEIRAHRLALARLLAQLVVPAENDE